MLITQLIPTIIAKLPQDGPGTIFIQQDNARAHITQTTNDGNNIINKGGLNSFFYNNL